MGGGGGGSTFPDRERHGHHTVGPRHSVQAADEVREVVQHTEVMLHHHHVPSGRQIGVILLHAILQRQSESGAAGDHLSAASKSRMARAAFSLCFTSK